MDSLFRDHPFFQDEDFLFPRGLREHFLRRRADGLNSKRLINELLQSLEDIFSPSSSSLSPCVNTNTYSLDLRGISTKNIGVTVSGRQLEVKVAGTTQSPSSSTEGGATDPETMGWVRTLELPDDVDPFTLTCTLGDDGFLRIRSKTEETPSGEHLLPIRYRTSLNFPLSNAEEKRRHPSTEPPPK